MKCARIVGQGIPARMSDDDAFCIVELMGDGEYCSKSVWREHVAHMRRHADEYPTFTGYMKLTDNDRRWLREKGLRP